MHAGLRFETKKMRKVILPFDGVHFSEGAYQYARLLNEKETILLTGVFLPQMSYANLWTYADGVGAPVFVPMLEEDDVEMIDENIRKFEERCVHDHIEFRVRKSFEDLALPELKKESRFADLMIIGGEHFYEGMGTGSPSSYLRETLHEMECCVWVVPEKFVTPAVNLLTYDGSASSVYAIKQFAFLLPEFTGFPTLLTYANTDEGNAIPFEPYIEELAARHFPDLTISRLDLDAKKYFNTWVTDKKTAIVVAGAFGRSSLSRLFKKSFVNEILVLHQLPVFIGHKK